MLNSVRGINSLFGRDSGRKRSFITAIIPQLHHPFRDKVDRSDRRDGRDGGETAKDKKSRCDISGKRRVAHFDFYVS